MLCEKKKVKVGFVVCAKLAPENDVQVKKVGETFFSYR